jgi:flagellar basal-body rod protein FlgF
MDSISISAASGMRARMESLELLANNLANVETGGYKADREFYSLYTSLDATADPQTGEAATLPVIEKRWTDFAQGDFHATGNQLDFAIDGEGLFSVATPRGVRYTRNGNFKIGTGGALTTADGSAVRALGGGQILLQAGVPIEVLPDGSVQQGGVVSGQMELVSFDPGAFSKEGTNYYAAAAGAKSKPSSGSVVQGKLESSNVGAAESAVRLVAIMRQFEMLQKAMSIGNDLNKEAIQEVARVAT